MVAAVFTADCAGMDPTANESEDGLCNSRFRFLPSMDGIRPCWTITADLPGRMASYRASRGVPSFPIISGGTGICGTKP